MRRPWPAELPTPGPAVPVLGSAIRVTIDLQAPITPAPQVQLTVFNDAYQSESSLTLGTLQSGTHEYTVSTQGSCSPSCRLVDLGVTWVPAANSTTQSVTIPLTVSDISERTAVRGCRVDAETDGASPLGQYWGWRGALNIPGRLGSRGAGG